MKAPEPRALPLLLAGAPQAGVLVHGRVALILQGGFRLEQDGVAVRVALAQESPGVELGAIVAVSGSWDGRELRAGAVDVLTRPQRPFGPADSEFAWAQRGGYVIAPSLGAICSSLAMFLKLLLALIAGLIYLAATGL